MRHITEIAAKAGIDGAYVEQYGNYKARVDLGLLNGTDKKDGHLIRVTAITPTPAGEGKTTTTIGLSRIGKNVMVALRERRIRSVEWEKAAVSRLWREISHLAPRHKPLPAAVRLRTAHYVTCGHIMLSILHGSLRSSISRPTGENIFCLIVRSRATHIFKAKMRTAHGNAYGVSCCSHCTDKQKETKSCEVLPVK